MTDGEDDAKRICGNLITQMKDSGTLTEPTGQYSSQLLSVAVNLDRSLLSETEQATVETMWGFDKIRKLKNTEIEMTEGGCVPCIHCLST